MAETSPLPSTPPLSFQNSLRVANLRPAPPIFKIPTSEILKSREPSGFQFRSGLLGNGSANFRFLLRCYVAGGSSGKSSGR